MSKTVVCRLRRLFGWLSILLFCVFVLDVAVGKYVVITKTHLPILPDVANFLLLFFATGCVIAYAAFSDVHGT